MRTFKYKCSLRVRLYSKLYCTYYICVSCKFNIINLSLRTEQNIKVRRCVIVREKMNAHENFSMAMVSLILKIQRKLVYMS